MSFITLQYPVLRPAPSRLPPRLGLEGFLASMIAHLNDVTIFILADGCRILYKKKVMYLYQIKYEVFLPMVKLINVDKLTCN